MNIGMSRVPAGRARRRTLVAAAVVALGLSGLAGCGTGAAGSPGVAAVSNGYVVTESMVDDVMKDLEAARAGGQIPRSAVVTTLALRPVVLDVGRGAGAVMGEEAVKAALQNQVPNASDATVQFQQTQATAGALTQDQGEAFAKAMENADITLSPRYGTIDKRQGVLPNNPNWIVPAAPQMPPGRQ